MTLGVTTEPTHDANTASSGNHLDFLLANMTSLWSMLGMNDTYRLSTSESSPSHSVSSHHLLWDNFTGNHSLLASNNTSGDATSVGMIVEVVFITFFVSVLAIITSVGNLMVMISFKMDKQLQTVSNYFLLSLSVADFAIGVVSMPLYTLSLLWPGGWPLGPIVCDIWLCMDYFMSNASTANLIIISLDRYLSVTRPLTYRAKRTPRRAAIMIALAWIISLILWPPWIIAWPYIEGKRTVPDNECYIQFLVTNEYITIVTAFAAFYLPVTIMLVLYIKIYIETEKRQKGLVKLQASKQLGNSSKRSEYSDEETYPSLSQRRSDSSPDNDDDVMTDMVTSERHRSRSIFDRCRCCRIDREVVDFAEDSSSSDHHGSPCGYETPSTRTTSLSRQEHHSIHGHANQNGRHGASIRGDSAILIPLIAVDSNRTTPTTPGTDITGTITRSTTGMSDPEEKRFRERTKDTYTIIIKLPDENATVAGDKPTVRMISDDDSDEDDDDDDEILNNAIDESRERNPILARTDSESCNELESALISRRPPPPPKGTPALGRRLTQNTDTVRMAMQVRVAAKLANKVKTQRARRRRQERKQDKKAAKTLSAILLAFIVTWTPYNLFTLVTPFCSNCIDPTLYAIGK